MSDILKKPVHLALLRPTQIQQLAASGVIKETPFGVDPTVPPVDLPKEQKVTNKPVIPKLPTSDLVKKSKMQIKLRVIHDRTPPIPADKQPDCKSCKTAACCRVFVVNITQLEYESGVYGDSAVKFTPEIYEQLKARTLLAPMLGAPTVKQSTQYFLEGKLGEPCPFLQEDNTCGIYEIRPATCRMYTCVGDSRITEGMRQGTEPITLVSLYERAIDASKSSV